MASTTVTAASSATSGMMRSSPPPASAGVSSETSSLTLSAGAVTVMGGTAETENYETRASALSAKRFLRYAEPSTKRPQDGTHRTRTEMHRIPKRSLEVIFRDGPLDRGHVQHQRLHAA